MNEQFNTETVLDAEQILGGFFATPFCSFSSLTVVNAVLNICANPGEACDVGRLVCQRAPLGVLIEFCRMPVSTAAQADALCGVEEMLPGRYRGLPVDQQALFHQ